MSRMMLFGGVAVLLLLLGGNGLAAACTYAEAMTAYERGNMPRAMSLMKMAARDGDQRAQKFLQAQQSVENLLVHQKNNTVQRYELNN